jgi:hypothetical protein
MVDPVIDRAAMKRAETHAKRLFDPSDAEPMSAT